MLHPYLVSLFLILVSLDLNALDISVVSSLRFFIHAQLVCVMVNLKYLMTNGALTVNTWVDHRSVSWSSHNNRRGGDVLTSNASS